MINLTFIYEHIFEPNSYDSMTCNETCCSYEVDECGTYETICFSDYNFTDFQELKKTPQWEEAVRWTYVALVVVLGVFGNLAIISILFTNRLLMRTSVNYFILNMAISDLILASAGPITFTIRDTNQFWVLGEQWCHFDGFLQGLFLYCSRLANSFTFPR